jgi:hypothetical protein
MLRNVFPWLVLAVACIACEPVNRYFGLEDDNWVESAIEDGIEYETGAQIDLTPSNPNDGFHLYPRK